MDLKPNLRTRRRTPPDPFRTPGLALTFALHGPVRTPRPLPFLEQSALHDSISGYRNYELGTTADPNMMVGSTKLKVLVAPNDPAPYDQIDWAWPYTGNGATYKQTLTSYAPNARVFGQAPQDGTFSVWAVAWNNVGAGKTKIPGIGDGTSNTLAVVEKGM